MKGFSLFILCSAFFTNTVFADSKVRVLIFPHILTYSIPEGRETVLNQVTLSSNEPCEINGVSHPPMAPWSQEFKAADILDPVELHCNAPVKVVREKGFQSYSYAGNFELFNQNGVLQVVNVVSLEDYIDGVVPTEMSSSWPTEALKAQAIAARSYALYEIKAARGDPERSNYDLDDTIFYQAYLGTTNVNPASHRAVVATSGQVMTYQGAAIKAYFHSDSGGHTESADELFTEAHEYCLGKQEQFNPNVIVDDLWKKSFQFSELTLRLAHARIIPEGVSVAGMKISSLDRSGRVQKFEIVTRKGPIFVEGQSFRLAVGLRSLLILSLTQNNDTLQFSGRGYGHGVGMNQSGARFLAQERAETAENILHFYYTGVEINSVGSFFPTD